VLLAVAGIFGGLAYGAQIHDYAQIGRLTGATLAEVPAAWVLGGLGALLYGFAPRYALVSWGLLGLCVLLFELGAFFGLDQRVVDVSPFTHVPKLPGAAMRTAPVIWLLVVAAALTAVGLAGLRRRDVG
jgi:ABC-2 type transport system permease protein